MNLSFFEKNLQFLTFQRNILAALSFLMAIALVCTSAFLFFKNERIIITPPVVEKEFWVDSNSVSPTYLEQFGCFLGQLLLSKSAYSASMQRAILLRHTDPSYIGIFKKHLVEEEEILKKQNSAYVFYPVEVKVNAQTLEVLLIGDRLLFVAGKEVSSKREGYLLQFAYLGTKLFLKNFSLNEGSTNV